VPTCASACAIVSWSPICLATSMARSDHSIAGSSLPSSRSQSPWLLYASASSRLAPSGSSASIALAAVASASSCRPVHQYNRDSQRQFSPTLRAWPAACQISSAVSRALSASSESPTRWALNA
jgi:hypothetical protein